MRFAPIAVVGQGCVLPGALSPSELWTLVREGRSAISSAPNGLWRIGPGVDRKQLAREVASDVGGYVSGFDQVFDREGFLVAADLLRGLDPVFLWTLHAAREALRSAGIEIGKTTFRGAVILGNLSYPTPSLIELALEVWSGGALTVDPRNRFMSGLPAQLVATAIGFGSASAFALDAACASSLYAIKLACDRLHDGSVDVALVGGVNHADDLFLHLGFTALGALSPTGRSRPFHRHADGLVPAQGAAMVVLKRLADAEAAGDRILGVLRAIGLSNDGRSRGLLVPSEQGQVRAMRAAYEMSGLAPEEISLVECHATGTSLGDAVEVASLKQVFASAADVPLGSLKSNLGHLITASGTAGLIKVLAAIAAETRPATLHADEPLDPLVTGPLRLLHAAEPWASDGPRRAAISNFGFGGNNAHLLVEEWLPIVRDRAKAPAPRDPEVVLDEEIAIVGQAVIAGGAASADEFAEALLGGRSSLVKNPARSSGEEFAQAVVGEFEFEVAGLRFPPSDLRDALPQQTLLLRAALALRDVIERLPRERTGLVIGMQCDAEVARCSLRWRHPGAAAGPSTEAPLSAAITVGCMPNVIANRVSHQLDLKGPSFTVSAEEASGTVALELAMRSLRAREIDAALVGAVDLSCEPIQRAAGRALLPEDRQPTGDAAVLLVLKRLGDARRDGDAVLAVLTASHAIAPGLALQIAANHAGANGVGDGREHDPIASLFGHAHAASGLLRVAAAVAACERRALPRGEGRSAAPWLPSTNGRRARVDVAALGGSITRTDLRADDQHAPPRPRSMTPRLAVFAAPDVDGLIRALGRRETSHAPLENGDLRIVLVAPGDQEMAARIDRAAQRLRSHAGAASLATLDEGIYFGAGPMAGELGFVFTGPAGAYLDVGRDLALGLPELVDGLATRSAEIREAAGWVYDEKTPFSPTPAQKLWASSYLCQLHAELTRGLLEIRPHASIGYCSGESNALFALGAWSDLDGFRHQIDELGVYSRELCGELRALRRAWSATDGERVGWITMRARAPIAEVLALLEAEPRVHLTIVNGPSDVVIAGDPEGCARVAARIGRVKTRPLDYDFVIHCPEMKAFAAEWRALHHRPTAPVPGVRFYTHATCASYVPTADTAADALLGQAENRIDFPALIERTYADGVRLFVEHGPHAGCTKWIDDVLGDRPHLAVALDRYGRSSLLQAVESVARLIAAGVPMRHQALAERLSSVAPAKPETLPGQRRSLRMRFPAHLDPVHFPAGSGEETSQWMAPAPLLPPVEVGRAIDQRAGESSLDRSIAPRSQGKGASNSESLLQPDSSIYRENREYSENKNNYRNNNLLDPHRSLDSYKRGEASPIGHDPPQSSPSLAAGGDLARIQHHAAHLNQLSELHRAFLRGQAEAQSQFIRLMWTPLAPRTLEQDHALEQDHSLAPPPPSVPLLVAPSVATPEKALLIALATAPARGASPVAASTRPAPPATARSIASAAPSAPTTTTTRARVQIPTAITVAPARSPIGPSFDRAQLEVLASGEISSVFGPLFRLQDGFLRQVRMPEPPLLLADRVLGIDAEPGAMGRGTLWTETDVTADAWYLHEGRMPAGILVESGQADLLLISFLGVDFHNRGERVYRLLGCDLTSHGELPRPGDTLRYEIHVDGHAHQGDVRLFFFHYDCRVNGELRVTVRNGQAGFFSDAELAASAGILWSAEAATPTAGARLDPPAVVCARDRFTVAELDAFVAGRARECFGPGFERADTHTRTPAIQGGRMRLLDEVTHFDPAGGPWGRGYLRARLALAPDHWFFPGHFKNDPCMPGTLMFEGCLQAMSIYLAALGFTLDRDGWRFEPGTDETFALRCRGQALPTSKEVIYEVFVDEIVAGPYPTLYADLLGTVDGRKAFHCRRMSLRLVPGWPLEAGRIELPATPRFDDAPVASVGGFAFDYPSLLACAWGRPSEAFGEMYRRFDGTRRAARLPGPPYHFMSRVTRVDGPIGEMKAGSEVEVAYDVPPDAWFFDDSGGGAMPYAVLLEVALQPCGWLASYVGCALTTETDIVFRNLDGTGTVRSEVPRDVGTIATTARLKSISTAGGLIVISFAVAVRAGDALIYELDTVFGFFSAETMRHQSGLPTSATERAQLFAESDRHIDLASRPASLFQRMPRLPGPKLLMIDRVTGLWPTGGAAGLGRVRAEKDIDAAAWFFKAHFFQDPVQPGSLGLEALLQALQILMIELGMADGIEAPRFEAIALDAPMTWKYRGQVVPENRLVVVDLELTAAADDARGRFAVAEGSLWVDGKRIYHARGVATRIVSGAEHIA